MNNDGNQSFMNYANNWIDQQARKSLGSPVFKSKSIVFAKIGAAIFLERKRLLSCDSCIDNNMMAFTLTDSRNSQDFFYYLFQRIQLGKLASTTALPSLSEKQLGSVRIPTPPSKEQHAIARILCDVDSLLGTLENLITKKRSIKQANLHLFLTKKMHFPGFSGKWYAERFEQIFQRLNGRDYQIQVSEYCEHGPYPVIDQGKETIAAFSDRADKLFRCPKEGLIVFGDHTCTIKFIDRDFVIGADGTQLLATKGNNVPKFFYYYLLAKNIPNTGYNRHFKFLQDLVFDVPRPLEQKAIATIFSDMDAEIAALEKRRDKVRAIKQGMMQQLLTGRIRLPLPPDPADEEEVP